MKEGRLARVPAITTTPENSTRQGFVTPDEFRRLVAELPEHLKGAAEFAYTAGWRIREVKSLRWSDIAGDIVTLRTEHSKNKTARRFLWSVA